MTEARDLALAPVDQDLKVASAALIRAYGGQVAASELLGRAQSRFSDAGSRNTAVFLTIKEVAEFEDRTAGMAGHPIVTRTLARRQGFELVRHPRAIPDASDLLTCTAALVTEGGDVMGRVGEALKDGRTDAAECDAIDDALDDLMQVAVTLKAIVAARRAGVA